MPSLVKTYLLCVPGRGVVGTDLISDPMQAPNLAISSPQVDMDFQVPTTRASASGRNLRSKKVGFVQGDSSYASEGSCRWHLAEVAP